MLDAAHHGRVLPGVGLDGDGVVAATPSTPATLAVGTVMCAEEVRRMSREERAKYNAEVEERHIRFSETAPVQSPFDEARLPGNERALYPYIGLSSAVHTRVPGQDPQGEKFCVTVIMARPGRGAPLHAHTTEEIFIALTAGGGASSGGRRSARCDPGAVGRRLGAVDARLPQRRDRGCVHALHPRRWRPPPPIYHLSVTQQVDEWHGRAPARPATQPIPAR